MAAWKQEIATGFVLAMTAGAEESGERHMGRPYGGERMVKRIKVRIDTGCVCEPYVYEVPGAQTQKARPRFKTEAEHGEHARKAAWARHRQKLNENLPGVTYRVEFSFDRKPQRTPEGADGRLPYGMAMLAKEAEARAFLDNCRLRVERLLRGLR